jgi:hypothetical protein
LVSKTHFSAYLKEWFSDVNCSKSMNCAAHYRYQAKHARRLADAVWQLDLQDMLRSLAKDYNEIAELCDQDPPRRASGRVISPTQGNKENPGKGEMPGLRSGSRG